VPEKEWELRAYLLKNPRDGAALSRLGQILRAGGRFEEAAKLFRRAIETAPDRDVVRLLLAQTLQRQGAPRAALDEVTLIEGPLRQAFEVQTLEAALLGELGNHAPQIAIYQKLLRQHPREGGLWMRLGIAQKYAGDSAASLKSLRRAVAAQPGYGEGWWSLANAKTFRFEAADILAMRKALAGKPSPTDAMHLHFALGKALEDKKDFRESFKHYAHGNRIRAANLTPEQRATAVMTRYVDEAIETFDKAIFTRSGGKGHPAPDPIFVLGLPRSGSTLVEQILATHPLIEGTSELEAMVYIWQDLAREASAAGKDVSRHIRELEPQRLQELGAAYLERTRPFRVTDRPYFIDKRPSNWMYVGLIRLILPNATIIDARRHPLACGFSNFKQHFSAGASFACDLVTIGTFYADYLRLMRHFAKVQPGAVHTVLNEALIDDPEGEIRRMLDTVGVAFDPACLAFHRNRREVRTPSAEQVRQPLNRAGTDQWRNYEPWLEPLKAALGQALTSWTG
jgi:tetratricopeptide (TPR) repeat protein